MARKVLYLLAICLLEVAITPNFLTAKDSVPVNSPEFNEVLTVEPEPEPEPVVSYTSYVSAPVYVAPAMANYTVSHYVGSVSEYNNTAYNLDYSNIYKFNKMIYGHNSWNLLGNLSSRYVGEVFTVTEGGVARQYQVTMVQTYQKTADGFLNGDKRLMGNIANTALGYDVALLTCAGTSYGNGDASHRLVVFANAI